MESYIAPGVYVTETTTLPYSVVEVSTAVPAFIGYTQLGPAASEPPKVARINSILDFESVFGGPQLSHYSVNAQQDPASAEWSASIADTTKEAEFRFYYSLYLFFQNGGGSCVVISVGNYSDYPAEKSRFTAGLRALEKEDEPTLILFPDAVTLLPATDYYTLCQESLAQGSNLEDRFTILDVPAENESGSDNIVEFRNGIGTTALQFGAAYHPFLQTSMSFRYNDNDVIINVSGAALSGSPMTLSEIKSSQSELYLLVRKTLSDQRIALPPSGAVAGIYARVDKQRGVWKAPANVNIAGVVGPTIAITSEEQDGLNVDPIAGKSINAIRAFTGRGILIWGARTLAGNNNEWRYISVRRLHNVIKESTKKSSAFFVFEPNDVNTWVKVQSMIENYLTVLWRQGALQGSKPEEAYYVRIGLGQSMSEVDVLEGRMIVEIGFAPVRPAEFIIIRFSHQLHSDNPIAPLGHQTETTISSTLIPMWPVSTEEALTNPGINLASSASFPARRIQTALNWEDLALAPGTKRQIDEVGHWIEHSATLKNSWGMANNFRSGYRCLFHGASGTGKTLRRACWESPPVMTSTR